MIKIKDIPKDIFTANKLILDQVVKIEKFENRIRELECRLFLLNRCPFCGHIGINKEDKKEIYFCEGCKSMMFENEFGGYETREAHKIN